MNTLDIRAAIDDIVADLSEPVTPDEQHEGWDDALKTRWRAWFIALKIKIENGEDVPAGWGILRAMDFDGIGAKPHSRLVLKAGYIGQIMDGKD